MLCQLNISNIAVIGNAEITFDNGLNILTGEAGAGKSLIIDSINLVLGSRVSRDIIRKGEKCARVEAAFILSDKFSLGNDYTEITDNQLILSREIHIDGKNICKANGRLITVTQLHEIGEKLLNIHGQNENISFLTPSTHLMYIDDYINDIRFLNKYREIFKEKNIISEQLNNLLKNKDNLAQKEELLLYWADEIEKADLKEGEEEELSNKRLKLQAADKLKSAFAKSFDLLYSNEISATGLLSEAISALDVTSFTDDEINIIKENLLDALDKIQESAHSISNYADNMDYETDSLDEIEKRLDLIHRLKSKYGKSVSEIIKYGEQLRIQTEDAAMIDKKIYDTREKLKQSEENLSELADKLTKLRTNGCAEIKKRVLNELSELDMKKVKFSVLLEKCDYTINGQDKCEFLISTNPAQQLRPMAKIASGGEMSRICLALKTVLSDTDFIDSLIFDEIDQGVSGIAAQKIGEKLKKLGENKQIICITHLPQIAAMADNHYLIEKDTSTDNFSTRISHLDKEGRIYEIARMMSGDKVSEQTLKAAEEMIYK